MSTGNNLVNGARMAQKGRSATDEEPHRETADEACPPTRVAGKGIAEGGGNKRAGDCSPALCL